MGYAVMFGPCFCCGRTFGFNPVRVPSVRDEHNKRQAVCRDCVEGANKERVAKGMDPFQIPDDAYGPVNEYELSFAMEGG